MDGLRGGGLSSNSRVGRVGSVGSGVGPRVEAGRVRRGLRRPVRTRTAPRGDRVKASRDMLMELQIVNKRRGTRLGPWAAGEMVM